MFKGFFSNEVLEYHMCQINMSTLLQYHLFIK